MSGTISINGTDRSGVIPFDSVELSQSAYLGEAAEGSIVVEDNTGLVTVTAHKGITVDESAASPTRLYTGYVGRSRGGRGETSTSSNGRYIEVTIRDVNELLSRRVFAGTDADRPRETIDERMTWLLSSAEINGDYLLTGDVTGLFTDEGAVASSSIMLDAVDFRGQKPGDVLGAMAKAARFNYYLRYSASSAYGAELVFRDDNTSTDDTATASISNAGDDDGSTIFAPLNVVLDLDSDDIYAGVYATHSRGSVYEVRASTASNYAWRDGTTEDSGIRNAATAAREARDFLWQSKDPDQLATVTLELAEDQVNLFQPGYRVSTRFTHLTPEGWEPAIYARILRRKLSQPLNPENHYRVTLDLSPQEAAPAAESVTTAVSSVQSKSVVTHTDNQLSFDNPVTIGNLLVALLVSRETTTPTMISGGGWTLVGSVSATATKAYSGDPLTTIRCYAKAATSTSPVVEREATSDKMWMRAWEIENATIAGAELLYQSEQPSGPLSIGTFDDAYGFVIMGCGIGRETDQRNNGFACTPGTGWTEIHDKAIDPGVGFGGIEPWIYYAEGSPTGGSLAATATIVSTVEGQSVGNWAGIAVLFPSEIDPGECLFERTASTVFHPLGGQQNTPNASGGNVLYLHPGFTWPETPTPGFRGRWYLPTYGTPSGGQGTTDYMGDCAGNVLRFIVVGDGTLTINTTGSGDALDFDVARYSPRIGEASWTYVGRYSAGDSATVTIDDTSAPNDCVRVVDLYNVGGEGRGGCGGRVGWTSATWTAE
jgi:hypothetical protein